MSSILCKCAKCSKKFKESEVLFIDPEPSRGIATPIERFLFKLKDGRLTQGNRPPMKSKGDKVPACPHCNRIHIHGLIVA